MPNSAKMAKEQRAPMLVGLFLQHWALMENAINHAIAKAMNLTDLQEIIVCQNIQFRDKIHILKTAVDLSYIYPIEKRRVYISALNSISAYATTRNMVAHNPFGASEDGDGVRFLVTKAKGKLLFPDGVWKEKTFQEAYHKLGEFHTVLEEITAELETAQLIDAMVQSNKLYPTPNPDYEPTSEQAALGLLGLPFPLPQADHTWDTNPASPQTDGETPPSEQG